MSHYRLKGHSLINILIIFQLPSYESVFTFQLLFTKGVAVELRRSFGALEDLNTTVVNSLKGFVGEMII